MTRADLAGGAEPGPEVAGDANPIALSVRGLRKVFPGTRALRDVDLTVRHGEVHALCGGNGCGKSTLIKILSGVETADAGLVTLGGEEVDAASLTAEHSYGLGFRVVHQDPALFLDLSVAENLMLGGHYPTVGPQRISWRQVNRRASELIEQFHIDASPHTRLSDLRVSVRTQIAIASAMQDVADARCVIALDEPTAALPADEVAQLLAAVRRLTALGHAVIFVSHRLEEVLSVSDRVTVMRDGQVFKEHRTQELTEGELIESILGRRATEIHARVTPGTAGEPVLTVRGLSAGPVQDVSFGVRAGEVVGVAGLLGSGRTELLSAIYGSLKRSTGVVELKGRDANFRTISKAIQSGVVMIPEDRAREAAFLDKSVDENLDLGSLSRYWRIFGFRKAEMRKDAETLRKKFGIKAPHGNVAMRTLSGGNQQKAIFARWLRHDAALLLLDEPTQGVDVGARADIYLAVREMTDNGGAALVVTSDLEELAQFVDRALVVRNGRLAGEVSGSDLTAHRLNELVHMQSGASHD